MKEGLHSNPKGLDEFMPPKKTFEFKKEKAGKVISGKKTTHILCSDNKRINKVFTGFIRGFSDSASEKSYFDLRTKLKPIAFILALIFSIQSIAWSDSGSMIPLGIDVKSVSESSVFKDILTSWSKQSSLKQTAEPVNYFLGKQKGFVVLLEDAHLENDAQLKIASVLHYLSKTWGIENVGVEGAQGEILHRTLSGFPHAISRKILADYLLSKKWISGPEYAALALEPKLRLYGIEDPQIYEQNRKAFLKGARIAQDHKQVISKMERTLESVSSLVDSKELRRFRREKTLWGKNKDHFERYALFLIQEKKKLALGIKTPHFDRLIGALHQDLKKHRSGDFDSSDPAISIQDFFQEMHDLENKILEKLLMTSEQKELDHWFQVLSISKKIMTLTLSAPDVVFWDSWNADFSAKKITEKMGYWSKRAKIKTRIRYSLQGFDRAFKNAKDFYRLALKRDDVMVQNAIQLLHQSKQKNLVLVTGGFHTAGLERNLQSRDISYLTLRPSMRDFENQEILQKKYLTEMGNERCFLEKLDPMRDPFYQLQTPRHFPTAVDQNPNGIAFLRSASHILTGLGFHFGENRRPSETNMSVLEAGLARNFYSGRNQQVNRKQIQAGLVLFPSYAGNPQREVFFWGNDPVLVNLRSARQEEILWGNQRVFHYGIAEPESIQAAFEKISRPVAQARNEVRRSLSKSGFVSRSSWGLLAAIGFAVFSGSASAVEFKKGAEALASMRTPAKVLRVDKDHDQTKTTPTHSVESRKARVALRSALKEAGVPWLQRFSAMKKIKQGATEIQFDKLQMEFVGNTFQVTGSRPLVIPLTPEMKKLASIWRGEVPSRIDSAKVDTPKKNELPPVLKPKTLVEKSAVSISASKTPKPSEADISGKIPEQSVVTSVDLPAETSKEGNASLNSRENRVTESNESQNAPAPTVADFTEESLDRNPNTSSSEEPDVLTAKPSAPRQAAPVGSVGDQESESQQTLGDSDFWIKVEAWKENLIQKFEDLKLKARGFKLPELPKFPKWNFQKLTRISSESAFFVAPLILIGLMGFSRKQRQGLHGWTAIRELTHDNEQAQQRGDMDPVKAGERLDRLNLIEEFQREEKPTRSGLLAWVVTALVEVASVALPYILYYGGIFSPWMAVGLFFALRAGMIFFAWTNEVGHSVLARSIGHQDALGFSNIMGNRSLFAWALKLLPLGWLIKNPYVVLKEVPSQKQSNFIRWGGWWISAAILAALTGFWVFGFSSFTAPSFFFGAFTFGALFAAVMAAPGDWVTKDVNPRFFACGIMGFFIPHQLGFFKKLIYIFELVRTVSVRGGQAGGFVTVHDIRSRLVIFISLATLLVLFSSSLLVSLTLWGPVSVPLWVYGSVAVTEITGALGFAFTFSSGVAGRRTRNTNPKRADLTLTMLSALIFGNLIAALFLGPEMWTLILAHARFSTSSPDPHATQPHTWIPTTLWNLIFKRKTIWYRDQNGYQSRKAWAESAVGHNGDMNGFYFRKLRKWISHNARKLHPFLNGLLQHINPDLGDTVNIAGVQKYLITEGNFEASVRRAHGDTVMDEPHEVLSEDQLKYFTVKFEKFFKKNKKKYDRLARAGKSGVVAMEDVSSSVIDAMTRDFLQEFPLEDEFEHLIPNAKWEEFVRKTFDLFHHASPFEAMKQFAVKVDPNQDQWVGGADGTFGLFTISPAYRSFTVYRKGQPVSLAFDADYKQIWFASERGALRMGEARWRLELLDDEILNVTWDDSGHMQISVFNIVENATVPKSQIMARMRDIREDPDVGPRPDPYEMFPLEANLKKTPEVVKYAIQSVDDPQDLNSHVLLELQRKLEALAALPELPEGVHILLYGSESNQSFCELIEYLVGVLYPDLRVKIVLPDDIAQLAVRYAKHPDRFMKELQITSSTLVIPISNSGRSFDVENDTSWLETKVTDCLAFMGDRDNLIADKLGPGRVFSTGVGGLQTSEARTHVNEAMHALITAVWFKVAENLVGKDADHPRLLFGSELSLEAIQALRTDLKLRGERIGMISGQHPKQKGQYRWIQSVGRRLGGFSLEVVVVTFVTMLIYSLCTVYHIPIFPSSIVESFGISILDLGWEVILSAVIADMLFLYLFGRIVVNGTWRLMGYGIDALRKLVGLQPIFARPMRKRPTTPTIYIGEAKYRYEAFRQAVRKTVALGWENTPPVQASEMGQINHEFAPNRGDVLIGIVRRDHPAQTGADQMAAQQFKGNRSFREGVFNVIIGHNLKTDNSDVGDLWIDLENPDYPSVDYAQFGFEEAEEIQVRKIAEIVDGLERAVAQDILLTAHARTLAFPWFVRIWALPLLHVPVLKWVLYLNMLRFPWAFRFYPYWATQGRTVMHTTATPTDMSPVQAELARLIAESGEENVILTRPIPRPAALRKKITIAEIPDHVYRQETVEVLPVPARTSTLSVPARGGDLGGNGHLASPNRTSPSSGPSAALRHELEFGFLATLLADLDRSIEHARGNGGVDHLYPDIRTTIHDLRARNLNPAVVTSFVGSVQQRLPGFRESDSAETHRAELRDAMASKDRMDEAMTFARIKAELGLAIRQMSEIGVDPLQSGNYFTTEHQDRLGIGEPQSTGSQGAYLLADYATPDFIREISAELPRGAQLLVYLDPAKVDRETRIQLVRDFSSQILAKQIVFLRSDINLDVLVKTELARRHLELSDAIELYSGLDHDLGDQRLALQAMLLGAAKLTENRLVVVSAQKRLSQIQARKLSFLEVYASLLAASRQVTSAA